MPNLRVLRPARRIPDKSTVTKRGGEKEYILRHRIEIYGNGPPDILEPEDGTAFLIDDGSINTIKDTTLLLFQCSFDELEVCLAADELEEIINANVPN